MRDREYETYGDSNREDYDTYITRGSPRNFHSNDRMIFFKNNKLFMLALFVGVFSFGALVIGLPVGLLAPSCDYSGTVVN